MTASAVLDDLVQAFRRDAVENHGLLIGVEVGEQCAAFASHAVTEDGRHRRVGLPHPGAPRS